MSSPHSSASRALIREYKNLLKEPMEGFVLKPVSEANIFDWVIGIFGPPDTVYAGGYFKLLMKFPQDYPYSPPSVKFLNKMWHPNVYKNGEVCISILHPPVDDPHSGELLNERWNPTQTVRTILLSIISLLSEPNTHSPANVEASLMYRNWKENGNTDYIEVVRGLVEMSLEDADKDEVAVPTTLEEYVVTAGPCHPSLASYIDLQMTDSTHESDSNVETGTNSSQSH